MNHTVDQHEDDLHVPALASHHVRRLLRTCSAADHARASILRDRCAGQHNRCAKHRCHRIKARSERVESRARDLAQEARW